MISVCRDLALRQTYHIHDIRGHFWGNYHIVCPDRGIVLSLDDICSKRRRCLTCHFVNLSGLCLVCGLERTLGVANEDENMSEVGQKNHSG